MNTQPAVSMNGAAAGGVSSTELEEILVVGRDFAAHELAPRALALDLGEAEAFAACWNGICEIGLDRALLDEANGGVGLGAGDLLCVLDELAKGDAGIAALVLLSNAALQFLPPEQSAAISEGERLALALLPEPGAPGSTALAIAGEQTASGRIDFALGAIGAAGLVLVVPDASGGKAYLVDSHFTGYVAKRDDAQLGLRGAPAAAIDFQDTRVMRIGGGQAAHEANVLLHAGSAAIARGVARHAHEVALAYAENRFQGGAMIVEHGAVRDMLAQISERNRVIAGHHAFHGFAFGEAAAASGDAALAQAIALKTAVTDAAVASTIDAVQVFGGMGYMHETGVEKLMRDAKYCQLFPRSNWLARDQLVTLERS